MRSRLQKVLQVLRLRLCGVRNARVPGLLSGLGFGVSGAFLSCSFIRFYRSFAVRIRIAHARLGRSNRIFLVGVCLVLLEKFVELFRQLVHFVDKLRVWGQ